VGSPEKLRGVCSADGSLAGRPVSLSFLGEWLDLSFMHAGHPIVRGRWTDPRIAGITQGMQVRAILVDPCVCLISSTDGPVTWDDDKSRCAGH